jgi:8-oxo-dGTP pyrophosphatase MutT (NUDIX family)
MTSIAADFIQVHLVKRDPVYGFLYLALQRSSDDKVYPGYWQVITGCIEKGETAVQAAVREVIEETGIHIGRLDVLPYVASFYHRDKDAIEMIPVFYLMLDDDAVVTLSHEHQEYVWLDYEKMLELLPIEGHRSAHEMLRRTLTGLNEGG